MAASSADLGVFDIETFDFIIVGGGTAGLALAARLSEDGIHTVGVLEAGGNGLDQTLISDPMQMGAALGSKYDWKFETTVQEGLGGRKLEFPRGKVLGGTSALNFMIWNRGCKEDYDAWEELGNPGWNWNALQKYFHRSERFTHPLSGDDVRYQAHHNASSHGTVGPIEISHLRAYGRIHSLWHPTLENLQHQTNRNQFSGSNLGPWTTQVSIDPQTQTRSYSASAYLRPNLDRDNLKILTGAKVNKILLKEGKEKFEARGVAVSQGGSKYKIFCKKEVILCAGSVQSPQLLELSGIGNKDILKQAGISSKVDLVGVGENLQEHIMTMSLYELHDHTANSSPYSKDSDFTTGLEQPEQDQRGPVTPVPSCIAYLELQSMLSQEKLTDLRRQVDCYNGSLGRSKTTELAILERQFSEGSRLGQVEYILDPNNYIPNFESKPGKSYASLMQILQYPYSRGSVHLNIQDTQGPPLIDPAYYAGLNGEVDLEVMIASHIYGDTIHRTEPLKDVIAARVYPPDPGEGKETDWRSYVRDNTITDWHPVGTCSMKPRSAGGVVDANLRVYGTSNLRVVDASVIPLHISCHIQASIYAIAEKAADMIRDDWRKNLG